MVVDFVPVVAVALIILFAIKLADNAEVVSDGLVGIGTLYGVKPCQVGMGIAFGFKDFDFALRSKYILQVNSSCR